MKAQTLRHLIIGLLLFTGVFHLAVALVGSRPDLVLPLAGFGVLYTLLSFYVRRDVHKGAKVNGRTAIILAMAAASAGLLLGGASYLKNGGPLALPFMFAIDAAIIGAGVAWLIKVHAKRN